VTTDQLRALLPDVQNGAPTTVGLYVVESVHDFESLAEIERARDGTMHLSVLGLTPDLVDPNDIVRHAPLPDVAALLARVARLEARTVDLCGCTLSMNGDEDCADCRGLGAVLVDGAGTAPPLTIADLQRESYETAVAKGWHDEDESPPSPIRVIAWMGLICSEAAEAIEDARKGRMTTTIREDGKPEGLPSELADVVIRACDTAGALGIDLEAELRAKLAFNRTRGHKHGGKLA